MENTLEKIERSYIKLSLGLLAGLMLFGFGGWGGWHLYQGWEARHLTRRAAAYLSGGDLKAATLSARHAFQLDSENAAAARVVAEAAERSGDRTALDWRRKATELEPNSIEDGLALVRCALQFGDLATAEEKLVRLRGSASQSAGYHATAALLARAKKDQKDAVQHWGKAMELAPNDKSFQLELAASRLASSEPNERETGRAELEKLRQDEIYGPAAIRALLMDGVAHHEDAEQLRDLARELQDFSKVAFADRMLYLEILRELNDPQFESILTEVEKAAPSKPTELATLVSWMNKNRMSLRAIDFAKGLPAGAINKWPVPIALADSYARLHDWTALEGLTRNSGWGNFEFLRHACLARALRGIGKEANAAGEWNTAMKAAEAQADMLSILGQAVSDWGWNAETIELLWLLTRFPDKKTEALRALYLRYAAANNTQGLYRVLLRLAETNSGDLDVQNNLAQISLLLNAEPAYARKLAEEVYRKDSANPFYAATYAYSLYSKGDVNGALKVMANLSEAQLREPAISAYYTIFLASSENVEKASQFVNQGEKAHLLPEEKALLEQAKRRMQMKKSGSSESG